MRRPILTTPPLRRPVLPFVDDEPAGIVFLSGTSWFAVNSSEVVQLVAPAVPTRRHATAREAVRPRVTWKATAPRGRQ